MKIILRFAALMTLVFSSLSLADGVSLNTTRIIYSKDAKQATVSSRNSSKETTYLLQSWVEDSYGEKSKRFIITPPLMTARPGSESVMRIILKDNLSLPNDRESVFYFNSKAIPSVKKEDAENKNLLIIAAVTRIKLFVRPSDLKIAPDEAPYKITFHKSGGKVKIINPTPYYITMVNLKSGATVIKDLMLAPKDETFIDSLPTNEVVFSTINDYGATTKSIKVDVK